MSETADKTGGDLPTPVLVPGSVIARMLNVSESFLEKDRTTAKTIPFIKLGDRCLYEPPVVLAAVRAMTVGGSTPSAARVARTRRAAA